MASFFRNNLLAVSLCALLAGCGEKPEKVAAKVAIEIEVQDEWMALRLMMNQQEVELSIAIKLEGVSANRDGIGACG